MESVESRFQILVQQLLANSESDTKVDVSSVLQEANTKNQKLVHQIMAQLVGGASKVSNFEALEKLLEFSKGGKSCLILPEHYSNFDLPNLCFLLEKYGKVGNEIKDRLVAVAGLKLTEESAFVRAFTEAYTRLVTYPPRSIEKLLEDPDTNHEELRRAKEINQAGLYQLTRIKRQGKIILVYPSGTRFRPGDESTRRGLKEMDSYFRTFDVCVFLGMAGNTLRINTDSSQMTNDIPTKDKVVFLASEVTNCLEFRAQARIDEDCFDKKQVVADRIMEKLRELHQKACDIRAAEHSGT